METEFFPPKRWGSIVLGAITLVLFIAGIYFFYLATQDPSGIDFLLHMMIALVIFLPTPLLVYRLYALLNAVYILRRDGLMIRWGLRREDVPLNDIEWIRPATELGFRLPLPWLRLPGGMIGNRRVPELGQVEFMAADLQHMVLVATHEKVYAISPSENANFMRNYHQIIELGSLSPLESQSVYPTLLLGRVWENRVARTLILSSLGVGLILLITVAIAVPNMGTLNWMGSGETAPAERLLLLPVLAGLIWVFNLVLGVFVYRRGGDMQIAAYLLWGGSGLTCLLLLIGSLLLIF
jgi:hypothetical protein